MATDLRELCVDRITCIELQRRFSSGKLQPWKPSCHSATWSAFEHNLEIDLAKISPRKWLRYHSRNQGLDHNDLASRVPRFRTISEAMHGRARGIAWLDVVCDKQDKQDSGEQRGAAGSTPMHWIIAAIESWAVGANVRLGCWRGLRW